MNADLTPMQQRTLELLRRRDEPLVFEREFVDELTADFRRAIGEMAERLDDGDQVFVSKHRLSSVLGCEEQYLLDDEFAWNPRIAGGQVAHRAVQLLVNWRGDPVPGDLIDESIARLAGEERGIGEWIAGLSDADLADLRHFATEKLIKFQECFPPLPTSAAPATESATRWPVDGPIVLSGKADLTLGRPRGEESTKVIIDLKTGRQSSRHREDLRFYALIETLRSGVPPRKLASFYLDAGEPVVEDVTEGLLRTAARRTLDAIDTHIELTVEGRPPTRQAGVSCHWCPISDQCSDGQRYLDHGTRPIP